MTGHKKQLYLNFKILFTIRELIQAKIKFLYLNNIKICIIFIDTRTLKIAKYLKTNGNMKTGFFPNLRFWSYSKPTIALQSKKNILISTRLRKPS